MHDTLISIFYHFLEMHSSGARNEKCTIRTNTTIDSPLENLLSIFIIILNIKIFYFSHETLFFLPSKYKERAERKGKERKGKVRVSNLILYHFLPISTANTIGTIEFKSLSLSSPFHSREREREKENVQRVHTTEEYIDSIQSLITLLQTFQTIGETIEFKISSSSSPRFLSPLNFSISSKFKPRTVSNFNPLSTKNGSLPPVTKVFHRPINPPFIPRDDDKDDDDDAAEKHGRLLIDPFHCY